MLIKNSRHAVLKYKTLCDFQGNLAVRLKLWNFSFVRIQLCGDVVKRKVTAPPCR
jgi:hypothetical protein